MECSKLISDSPHCSTSGRSCVTNLLSLSENVIKIIGDGGCVHVIYLDFLISFDEVPHQRLLLGLQMHGIVIGIRNLIGKWASQV